MLPDGETNGTAGTSQAQRILLKSRLAYHLRCLPDDVTDPEMTALERLALVRDRARRIREIRMELAAATATIPGGAPCIHFFFPCLAPTKR